jgi:anti-anti-sigma factor
VTVRGELDRDGVWAIDYTIARASAEAGRIVLDLREVTHVDYRGVSALVDRSKELRGRGGDLAVAVRNPYVANILKAAGGSELLLCRAPEEAFGRAAAVLPLRARRSP